MQHAHRRIDAFLAFASAALVVFGLHALGGGDPTALLVAVTTALVIAVIAIQVSAARATTDGTPGVGRRARAHRQALDAMPAPQHPSTEGRPRTRAPARPLPVA
jgi:hypothetical protein